MEILQLKVTLKNCRPPIWRRILVPLDIRLPRLHRILQIAMGWTDSHLHAFTIHGEQFGVPDEDFPDTVRNERNVRLDKLVGVGGTFVYEYDFGDGWEHVIKVEKILPAMPGVRIPLCLAGKRACPPEDCGGAWGYENLLAVLRDPAHEEHNDMLDWLGGEFDPEAFDIDVTNVELRTLK